MLVHLAITLSAVDGWGLPWDDQTSSLSSNESAITGGADGARDRRQLEGFWDRFDGIEARFPKTDPSAAPKPPCTANLPFTRIFENSKKNLSGKPFEKNFAKPQRKEGKIP